MNGKRRKVIRLVMLILCFCGCLRTLKETKAETLDYENVYNNFIKQVLVEEYGYAYLRKNSFRLNLDEDSSALATRQINRGNIGIIGGYIEDLDKDTIPELIVSYVENADENVGNLVIDIYTLKDGIIKKIPGAEEQLRYEFFYNKCQGNLHIFLQEQNGETIINVLKAYERSFGTLYYDVMIDTFSLENGELCRKTSEILETTGNYINNIENLYERLKPIVQYGDWFVQDFKIHLGETGTSVFAPYDYDLTEKDDSIKEVLRIKATRQDGIQSYKYFDYSDLIDRVFWEKAYKKLLEKEILPDIGRAYDSFGSRKDLKQGETFGTIDEIFLGLVGAQEYDCNNDGKSELLVFYLKQEEQQISGGTTLMSQKLYIDLYTQKDEQAIFVGTVDILEPVIPWSSVFSISDILEVWFHTYENNTYLLIQRESGNEGPYQKAIYIYNLTDINAIQKTIYYMPIADAGRLNGELMIPATLNGGSSGEHEFIVKIENGLTEIYFESFSGIVDTSYGEAIFQSFEEAENKIKDELKEKGINLDTINDMESVFSWELRSHDHYVYIDDSSQYGLYEYMFEDIDLTVMMEVLKYEYEHENEYFEITQQEEEIFVIESSPVKISDYIFKDSNNRYLSREEVMNLSQQTLCYAKNEIYARHGRQFVSQELQDYFNSKSWYQGNIPAANFSESVFNEYEISNIDLLVEYEFAITTNGYQLDQPGYDIQAIDTSFHSEVSQVDKEILEEVSKDGLTEDIYGSWLIDAEKFSVYNAMSLNNAFGSSIKYGYEMTFSENGSFSYYIAAGVGGEGYFRVDGNHIIATITTYEEGNQEEISMQLIDENGTTYVVMDNGYLIHWQKQ